MEELLLRAQDEYLKSNGKEILDTLTTVYMYTWLGCEVDTQKHTHEKARKRI